MKVTKFAYSASVVALLTAVPTLAFAQDAPDEAAVVEEIVVTGSRIQGGFQAPTPVTVVGAQELQRNMPTTVANYLNSLPAFGNPTSSANPGSGTAGAGAALLNLRNLDSPRTLVMLDNRRVVASNISGGVDINTLPTTLIQRVEVVTGGASAAWGADAIAGVVNFVLDHNFEGVQVGVQYGISEYGDNENQKIDLTFGRSFLDGRASIVGAFTHSRSPDLVRTRDRRDVWWERWSVNNNPACSFTSAGVLLSCPSGQPRQIWGQSNLRQSYVGGVIVGPATYPGRTTPTVIPAQPNPTLWTKFDGPTGTPSFYDPGYSSTAVQVGGTRELTTAENRNLTNPLTYSNAFFHGRFDFTDNVTGFAEFSWGDSNAKSDSIFYNRPANITLLITNPFLPAPVKAQFDALNAQRQVQGLPAVTNFTFSRLNTEGGNPGGDNDRRLLRFVAGFEGQAGDWNWSAYAQRGEVKVDNTTLNNGLVPRYNAAIQAVRDPVTQQIYCQSAAGAAVTITRAECKPFNVFGLGAPSQESVDWIFGTPSLQEINLTQQFVSAEASGPVFELPAGPLTVAIGADYSKEKAVATSDPNSMARNFVTGNPQPFFGKQTFLEGFAEANIPLLKDLPFFNLLELSAASRLTDYLTSGTVTTWKIGLSNNVTDELRLRYTRSRDIRAPSLSDLFSRGAQGTQTVFDPITQISTNVRNITSGNPDLQPEEADTWTAGVVYRPGWLPGLAVSVDYYDIKIKGAIVALQPGETVELCFTIRPDLCERLFRDSAGFLTEIRGQPTNIGQLATSGVDIEVLYRRPLFDGQLSLRALGAYQPDYAETDSLGNTVEYGGSIEGLYPSQPDWKGNFSVGYETGPYALTASYRYVGAAVLRNEWVEGVDIDDNTIEATGYFDLQGAYDFNIGDVETRLTFAISNVLNTPPRIVPTTPGVTPYAASSPSTRMDLYDAIGRSFRVGLRAKF